MTLPATSVGVRKLRLFIRSPKGYTLLALLAMTLAALPSEGTDIVPLVAAAAGGAWLLDLLMEWVRTREWRSSSSGLIAGFIVAMVLSPAEPWYVFLAVGAISTGSKHILRIHRRHLFNPAAVALLISVFLFSTAQSWWGALSLPLLPLVFIGGILVTDKINKLPQVLSFLGAYFLLFTLAALAGPTDQSQVSQVSGSRSFRRRFSSPLSW